MKDKNSNFIGELIGLMIVAMAGICITFFAVIILSLPFLFFGALFLGLIKLIQYLIGL